MRIVFVVCEPEKAFEDICLNGIFSLDSLRKATHLSLFLVGNIHINERSNRSEGGCSKCKKVISCGAWMIFHMRHDQKTPRQKYIHCLSIIVLAIVLAVLSVMLKAYLDGHFNSVESFQKYISRFGWFGPIFLMVFQAVQVVLNMLLAFKLACGMVSVEEIVPFDSNMEEGDDKWNADMDYIISLSELFKYRIMR